MKNNAYIAFDLGAESGRAVLATLVDGKIEIEVVHRFANLPQQLPSGYHWNLLDLWRNLLEGLTRAGERARERDVTIRSIGVDTWGVDFGLIGKSGQPTMLPYAYRDSRFPAAEKAVTERIGREKLYMETGIQFMPFNSLFQLYAQFHDEPASVTAAAHLLFMPDMFHYFFTGKAIVDATAASTSQMVDPKTGKWHTDLLGSLGLPTQMLGEIVPAGTKVGKLLPHIARQCKVEQVDVIAPGGHDTAAAIAAVPVAESAGDSWAYLSSGTWSLMGAEIDTPCLTDAALAANFTHERAVGGKIRLLKNIAGLWLVQQVRADFASRGEEYEYAALTNLAGESEPFRTLLNTRHAPFASPGDMCAKIAAFAKQTNQPAPHTPGQFVRACLESLALTYRETIDDLEHVMGRKYDLLHVVGGGGQNELLNEMTANALGRPVIVGPTEATAIGNALVQAMGAGDLQSLADIRTVVRNSCEPKRYEPTDAASYEAHWSRFSELATK